MADVPQDHAQKRILYRRSVLRGGRTDLTEDKDYTNDDCHYYFDCCRSVAYRKYEAEIRKINRKLAALGKEYGFQEYVCTARFSNGEAWYDLASNSRARLKSVVA